MTEAIGLLCERVREDGRCNHPVTGERHGDVIPEAMRQPCADPDCDWIIRRDPADHPEMLAFCVNHLDDDVWLDAALAARDEAGDSGRTQP